MSIAYKKRKKAIREAKRQHPEGKLSLKEFRELQASWQRAVDGLPLCSLADILGEGT